MILVKVIYDSFANNTEIYLVYSILCEQNQCVTEFKIFTFNSYYLIIFILR